MEIYYFERSVELPEIQTVVDNLGLPDDAGGGSAVPDVPAIAAAPDADRLLIAEKKVSTGIKIGVSRVIAGR